jgi:hypothetical protein
MTATTVAGFRRSSRARLTPSTKPGRPSQVLGRARYPAQQPRRGRNPRARARARTRNRRRRAPRQRSQPKRIKTALRVRLPTEKIGTPAPIPYSSPRTPPRLQILFQLDLQVNRVSAWSRSLAHRTPPRVAVTVAAPPAISTAPRTIATNYLSISLRVTIWGRSRKPLRQRAEPSREARVLRGAAGRWRYRRDRYRWACCCGGR